MPSRQRAIAPCEVWFGRGLDLLASLPKLAARFLAASALLLQGSSSLAVDTVRDGLTSGLPGTGRLRSEQQQSHHINKADRDLPVGTPNGERGSDSSTSRDSPGRTRQNHQQMSSIHILRHCSRSARDGGLPPVSRASISNRPCWEKPRRHGRFTVAKAIASAITAGQQDSLCRGELSLVQQQFSRPLQHR